MDLRALTLRSRTRSATLVAVAVAGLFVAACEPPDAGGGGGGGGVGGKLAFIRTNQLVVSQDDGNGERTLTDPGTSAAEPALSPDGQTVAFAYSQENNKDARALALVGWATGSAVQVLATPEAGTGYGEPTWDRTGQHVVFVATTSGQTHLMTMASSGGAPQPLAPAVTDVHFPVFLDDNTLLVVAGAGLALSKVDLTAGTVSPLGPTTISRAAVSPDRKSIAYSRDEQGGLLVVRDVATGQEKVFPSSGQGGDVKPAFSPDGTLLAFEAKGKLWQTKVTGDSAVEPLQSGTDVSWGP